jgi:hypothetical protein
MGRANHPGGESGDPRQPMAKGKPGNITSLRPRPSSPDAGLPVFADPTLRRLAASWIAAPASPRRASSRLDRSSSFSGVRRLDQPWKASGLGACRRVYKTRRASLRPPATNGQYSALCSNAQTGVSDCGMLGSVGRVARRRPGGRARDALAPERRNHCAVHHCRHSPNRLASGNNRDVHDRRIRTSAVGGGPRLVRRGAAERPPLARLVARIEGTRSVGRRAGSATPELRVPFRS